MENESSQQFCLRWHNHQSSVLGGLPALLDSGRLTDVTLCAGGRSLRAHRIVLSTCSPYFMDIFKELPSSQQPVIVVLGGGWAELCCLVAFMYAGEVTLPRSLLPGLLKLAAALRITGLTDLNGNIPEVPQSEFDFGAKLETNLSPDDPIRQNDSASSTENISPFQKSFESHLATKHLEPLHISQHNYTSETNISHEEPYQDKIEFGTRNITLQGKRRGRSNEKRYLNPALNEIDSKNRKIDKIVENLKCNQRRNQEILSPVSRGKSQLHDLQKSYLNLSPSNIDSIERLNLGPKFPPNEVSQTGSKAADIYAGSNIFMETDSENIGCEILPENVPTVIKTEADSSPEIISDLKYVPLSPGIQSIGIHSPTNTKLYATCYVCHKQLSNQYNLRVHLETHQNARHACVACSHVSRSRDALRKHVSYRHPQLSTSHGVGRPCKANQNAQNILQSAMQTPPPVPNIFNFPCSNPDMSESIDLSANANIRRLSAPDNVSVGNVNPNPPSNSAKVPIDKVDSKNKSSCGL